MRWLAIPALAGTCAVAAAVSAAAPSSPSARNGLLVFDGVDPLNSTVQIYRLSPTGRGLRQLTHAPSGSSQWSECPSWSSNGRTIFFDSDLPALAYRMSSRGTHRTRIDSRNAPPHTCPSPNKDASHLVVIEHPNRSTSRIVRMTAKGRFPVPLVQSQNPYQNFFNARYAPTRQRISFSLLDHYRTGRGYRRADIVILYPGGHRVITAHRRGHFYAPAWAANGKLLVAVRGDRFGGNEIVTMKPDGSSIRHAAWASASISSVALSPDGRKIAYVQCKIVCSPFRKNQGASIWIVNVNGSGRHRILRQIPGHVAPVQRVDWAPR